jgi:hypothetical protein
MGNKWFKNFFEIKNWAHIESWNKLNCKIGSEQRE